MASYDEKYFGSNDRDFKRTKNSSSKWSNGARPKGNNTTITRNERENYKSKEIRPQKKPSEIWKSDQKIGYKRSKRMTRLIVLGPPVTRVQRKVTAARNEIDDAPQGAGSDLVESCPLSISGPAHPQILPMMRSVSNWETSMPERRLPLEAYTRPDLRATEKFVEKEYEVLDWQGEAVKGKRARRILRVGKDAGGEQQEEEHIQEDEGYELV